MFSQDEIKRIQTKLNEKLVKKLSVDGDAGPLTKTALFNFMGIKADANPSTVVVAQPSPIYTPKGDAPWMEWIKPHIGEKEIYGSKDNPFIMDLYPDGNYPQQHDEVPWCACLANAALKRTGFKGTNSAAAKSFDGYGTKCELKYGAVVTLRHKSGGRHVTFFVRLDSNGNMVCLGGNQGNALKESTFPRSELVWCGWPVEA